MTKVVFYQNRWGWERISYSWDAWSCWNLWSAVQRTDHKK